MHEWSRGTPQESQQKRSKFLDGNADEGRQRPPRRARNARIEVLRLGRPQSGAEPGLEEESPTFAASRLGRQLGLAGVYLLEMNGFCSAPACCAQ